MSGAVAKFCECRRTIGNLNAYIAKKKNIIDRDVKPFPRDVFKVFQSL